MNKAVIIFLIVHLLCMAVVLSMRYFKFIRFPLPFVALVVWVPVFGPLCVLITHYYCTVGRPTRKTRELESMRSSEVWDEEGPSREPESANNIPLEDALILDDPATRRSVMLDILMENSKEYAGALSSARMNDDVEVVHYATTAMAEFSKEYELRLQQYAQQYSEKPDDVQLLAEYVDYLQGYLASGLCVGQLLEIQRSSYQQLLRELLIRKPSRQYYLALASSYMDSKQYRPADEILTQLEEDRANYRDMFAVRMRYYFETGQGDKLQRLVTMCKEDDGYRPADIRDLLSFWDTNPGEEAGA